MRVRVAAMIHSFLVLWEIDDVRRFVCWHHYRAAYGPPVDRLFIISRCHKRIAYFEGGGLERSDRVFIQYGNNRKFLVDLI